MLIFVSYHEYSEAMMRDQSDRGTLNTRQQRQTILRLTEAGSPLMIEGRLAKSTVVGQGGERYRLIAGILKPVSGP